MIEKLTDLLKVLTWNISHTDPSFSSPEDWDRIINVHEITQLIQSENSDIFCLQEMPTFKFGMRFIDYFHPEPVQSHSGWLSTFVRKNWKTRNFFGQGFTSRIEIEYQDKYFTFVSCHLFPFKNNSSTRFGQLEDILHEVDDDMPLIIAGDMNMREDETKQVLSSFNVKDAFYLKGSKETKFTWDSRINRYNENSHKFIARFDRIFIRGFDISEFRLIGNKPISENNDHFLSDHYGIVAELNYS